MTQGTAIETSVTADVDQLDDRHLPDDDGTAEPGETAAGADPAIETRARAMGWKPLNEYRGQPDKWRPAAEFIARGEEILPIVRDQNRQLTTRVAKLEGMVTSLQSTGAEQLQIIKDLREMGQRADQRGYDRAMAEIRAKQRAAVAVGDTAAYDQLVEQAEALDGSRAGAGRSPVSTPPVAPPAAAVAAPATSPAVQDFIAANPWFNRDAVLNASMIAHHVEVIKEGRIVDEAAQLEEARQRLMDAYPDRFGVPRQPAPQALPRQPTRLRRAAVAAPTPDTPPATAGNGAATINSISDPAERAEARDAFNRMKRQMPDYTEAEYMALYADPRGDILAMQQKPRSAANVR